MKEVVCPYCQARAGFLLDSSPVYSGRDYGPLWICGPCGAYVGCHKGTTTPLGTLANAALRDLRKQAHAALDPFWKDSDGLTRSQAYERLAGALRIPVSQCHVAMFDEDRCKAALGILEGW
jgi:hypothetical protein